MLGGRVVKLIGEAYEVLAVLLLLVVESAEFG